MDDELRIGLWNVLTLYIWQDSNAHADGRIQDLSKQIWIYYFKRPADSYPHDWGNPTGNFREYFFKCPWNEAYDFIEFVIRHFRNSNNPANTFLVKELNTVLEQELSAYRLVQDSLIEITNSYEVFEIERALEVSGPFSTASIHLQRSAELLADRENPDYRNSIKESISAVESLGIAITGTKGTLGQTLKPLEEKLTIHPALKDAFSKLYGYTSDAHGIRHALMDKSDLDFEDAKFMLISCSAFLNYVIGKATKASIPLK